MSEQTAVSRGVDQTAIEQPALLPLVDVVEDDSGITLYADLPGVPKDLEATHVEVNLPRYRRVFSLSKELDPGKLSAELKQGVLKLRIQKAERAKPRRIEVAG